MNGKQPFPDFTDLGAVADELARRGDNKLRAAMTQAWRTQSCLGDLRQSADAVVALQDVIKRPQSEDTLQIMIVERSLMTTAIMLYARATGTNSAGGERGAVQLSQSKLTPEEWRDHQALLDVRNKALAHVHKAERAGDHNWHRDIFFAVYAGSGHWKPASASNQTSYHAPTLERLDRALPVAHREVKALFNKRMNTLTNMINDDVKAEALAKHIFDPVPVFGSEEGVKHILAGAASGMTETAFWINEGDRRSRE